MFFFFAGMPHFVLPPPPLPRLPFLLCLCVHSQKKKKEVKPKCGWYRDVNWLRGMYNQPLHALDDCIDDWLIFYCRREAVCTASPPHTVSPQLNNGPRYSSPCSSIFPSFPFSFSAIPSLKRSSQMPHQQGLPFIIRWIHCSPFFLFHHPHNKSGIMATLRNML